MHTINIENTSLKPKKNATRKQIIVAVVVAVVLLIIIGVVLAVVLTTLNKNNSSATPVTVQTTSTSTTAQVDAVNSRIDCLPWLKNKNEVDVDLENACRQRSGCKFQPVDGNTIWIR